MFYINFCWRKGEQRTRKGEKENEERKQQVEEEEAVETTTNSAGRKINKESARTNGMQLER